MSCSPLPVAVLGLHLPHMQAVDAVHSTEEYSMKAQKKRKGPP